MMLQESQKDGELYFANLDENILPSMVILGPRCSLTAGELDQLNTAIRGYSTPITVTQAMLSSTSFEVIEDPIGLKANPPT